MGIFHNILSENEMSQIYNTHTQFQREELEEELV